MISFNGRIKVTKRHMDVLEKYVPVKEYGYPRKYWISGREYKTRKQACDQQLHLFQKFIESGFISELEKEEVLQAMNANNTAPLFVEIK